VKKAVAVNEMIEESEEDFPYYKGRCEGTLHIAKKGWRINPKLGRRALFCCWSFQVQENNLKK
jgi:hypothetical protein